MITHYKCQIFLPGAMAVAMSACVLSLPERNSELSTTSAPTGGAASTTTTGEGSATNTTGEAASTTTTGEGSATNTTGEAASTATTGEGSITNTTGEAASTTTTGEGSATNTTGEASTTTTRGGSSSSTTGGTAANTTTGGAASSSTTGPPTLSAVVTTMDKNHLLAAQATATFRKTNDASKSQYVFNLNKDVTYQTMDGFGASLTDSSAWLLWNRLSPSQRQDLMKDLFSPEAGIGLSFLRQPMGASDASASGNYSYDDVPRGQTDTSLHKFTIGHDEAYIIPLLQQALALNPAINVYATPWSPPAWMKSTHTMNGGSLESSYYGSMAQYFVKFVQAYKSYGIPIFAVSPQNEPENNNGSYPTTTMTAAQEASFVANDLGPAMTAAAPSVKIVGYEHNWGDTTYPKGLLADAAAARYLAGTSFHCYSGSYGNQSVVEAAYPAKSIWFTECSGTVGSNFGGDLGWNAYNLFIGSVRNWARAVSLWNLALDENSGPKNGGCASCRGVVTIDTSKSPAVVTRNVEYYLLGHLAKYVRPGAVRIESNTSNGGGIEDVAFKNPDGSTALFILNGINASVPITINWNGYGVNYNLLPNAIYTMTWPAHS